MNQTFDAVSFSTSYPSTSTIYRRPISSLSSSSLNTDPDMSTPYQSMAITNPSSVNSSSFSLSFKSPYSEDAPLDSSPISPQYDVNSVLRHTAALLAMNNQNDSLPPPPPPPQPPLINGDENIWIRHQRPPVPLNLCNEPPRFRFRPNAININSYNFMKNRYEIERSETEDFLWHPSYTRNERKSPKPESYKTVMCQAWLECGKCNFGENCRFAHGEAELRPATQSMKYNAKYKTKLCDKYTMSGLCPYGNRCLFIHPDASDQNAYIRPDRLARMQQERRILLERRTQENNVQTATNHPSTPLTSRECKRPHPSWPLEPPTFYSAQRSVNSSGFTLREVPLSDKETNERDTHPTIPKLQSSTGVSLANVGDDRSALCDISNRPKAVVERVGSLSPSTDQSCDSSPGENIIGGWSVMSTDPFTLALGNDNLARHLATIFNRNQT
ncbi:hypothetical protein AB6A40_001013 [Gnathostoma spinigerum]|uniref:C3H1-type domain-containing protein n=1 Tax=Gnathostoma spinigerum TaxID=75299 RepID=A0ABD6E812_9BILA